MLVGTKIGPFQIEKELGSGAMGTVYKAKFDHKGKVVPSALKVVSLGLMGNESAMARFDREANILKQLRHPHIVRLYGTGTYRNTPFIAMEYVDGESMDRILARRSKFGWDEVFGYGKQLCEALQHAHEKGIIHRDLKPSNLMITRDGKLKLTDFGIAKDTDVTALTAQNSTIGTAAYMSPEQCRGVRELSAKSDLYSLGVVLYELITGKKPFYADTTMDMFLKHVNEKPVDVWKLAPDLPREVNTLVMQLLEKKPEARPYDAATVGRLFAEIEEKVQSLQSAGMGLAGTRLVDRRADDAPLSAEDKDALRAIKGKKKKKKKAVPLWKRAWVKAVGIGLVLAALVAVGVWLTLPAPPGKAFARVKAAADEDKLEESTNFLKQYAKTADAAAMADEARGIFKEAWAKRAEKAFDTRYPTSDKGLNRHKAMDGEDQDALDAVWAAMDAEKAGDLKRAADWWKQVRDKYPEPDPALYATNEAEARQHWSSRWAAEKRLADLAAAEFLTAPLLGKAGRIELTRLGEDGFKTALTDPEALATRAVRLEQFGDKPKARRAWAALFDETADNPDKHRWHLLAARRRQELPETKADEALAARIDLVAKYQEATAKQWADAQGQPEVAVQARAVRIRCRELIDLYDDEPDDGIKAQVAEAKKLLPVAVAR